MPDDAEAEVIALIAGAADEDPYSKWDGTHWRLVELADLAAMGTAVSMSEVRSMVDAEFRWLLGDGHVGGIRTIAGLTRAHASQEGNAIYALSILGWADDQRTKALAERLMSWQWPDGGWNCDRGPGVVRSSFHESVTPALGLAVFGKATRTARAVEAAHRTSELILESGVVFSRTRPHTVVHPSWTILHYPPYWHYDVLQGLRLLAELDLLADPRAAEAVEIVKRSRSLEGFRGRSWASGRQPPAIIRGRSPSNRMLNELALRVVLTATGAGTGARATPSRPTPPFDAISAQ
ncbi:hypothetical protein [Microbacterium sp.]|jgi:hypothetical protein|uniref:hypothetical protein n=1 Tax=Microbacterium sp. TaxID=51671 RepID=UPI00260D814D|nr:hypothetical protein [Microbacterium sp.]